MTSKASSGFILLLLFGIFEETSSVSQVRLSPDHWHQLDKSRPNSTKDEDHDYDDPSPARPTRSTSTSDRYLYTRQRQPRSSLFITRDMLKRISPNATLAGFRSRRKREDVSDALSKNITMILEDLLMNYDKTERPAFKTGRPTNVKINVLIRSMGPISEEDMNYSMDCYFRQYWRDERLSFTGLKKDSRSLRINQLSLNVKMLEKIWKPDTYFHNGLSSYLHTITRPNKLLRISEHGDITYSMRLTIKAKCPMMLRSFPMDWQTCPLIIGSFAYTSDEVLYLWSNPKSSVDYDGKLQLSQFDIKNTNFRGLNYSRSTGKDKYSVLQVVISLQRHTGYFLIQIYLPCILLVVLSWVGFWLNREATSDRVGLGITTVLTLSTISLESRTSLPKVHYATALDWFIICSFGYCIATLLEFAGVHYFTKVGSGEVFGVERLPETMSDSDDDLLYDDDDDDEPDEDEDEDEWQDMEVSEEIGGGIGGVSRFCPQHNHLMAAGASSHLPGCNSRLQLLQENHVPLAARKQQQQHHQQLQLQRLVSNGGRRVNVVMTTMAGKDKAKLKRIKSSANGGNMLASPPSLQYHQTKLIAGYNPVFNADRIDDDNDCDGGISKEAQGAKTSLTGNFDFCDSTLTNSDDANYKALHHSLESVDQLDSHSSGGLAVPPPPPPVKSSAVVSNSLTLGRINGHPSLPQLHTHLQNSYSLPSMVNAISGSTGCPFELPHSSSLDSNVASGSLLGMHGLPSTLPPPPQLRQQVVVVSQAAQTQTEKKTSCFRQFAYCLLANQAYRKARQKEAAKQGSTNSNSRIDAIARIMFPLSFGLFNFAYWYSYLAAQKPFDWDDHDLKGNILPR